MQDWRTPIRPKREVRDGEGGGASDRLLLVQLRTYQVHTVHCPSEGRLLYVWFLYYVQANQCRVDKAAR